MVQPLFSAFSLKACFRAWGAAMATLLLSASCTQDLPGDDGNGDAAISFSAPAVTRAAVESFQTGDAFSVWGWYNNNNAIGNPFSGETVTSNGSAWSYTGGLRYWVLGATYDFYAVYPSSVKAECDEQGHITVTDFDASATGDDAVDLMTATATGIIHATADDIQPVGLEFGHALTRVGIAVKLADEMPQGYRVTVDAVWLRAYGKGDMTLQASDANATPQWTVDNTSFKQYSFTDIVEVTAIGGQNTATPVIGNELLLVPQAIKDGGEQGSQFLYIHYKLENDVQAGEPGYQFMENDINLPLSNASMDTWNPGEALTYVVEISNSNVALVLQVGDWEDGNAGNEDITME